MSILSAITNSQAKIGIRAVIFGTEGIGKTTLAANAPRPLLIPLETGYTGVVINKVPMLEHYSHVMQLLDEIIEQCQAGTFPYQSLVFDSATALERLIHTAVLQTDPTYAVGNKKAMTMESALGGFGKAYTYANQLFDDFLKKCDVLAVNHCINIVITSHAFPSLVQDPNAGEYNSWDILLHSPKNNKTYGKREMITQWADIIGFLHDPIYVVEGEGKKMSKGVSANKGRVLAVCRAPSYTAKNRYGITMEIPLPAVGGWNMVAHAIHEASKQDYFNRD